MSDCSHNCGSCGESCSSRQKPESLLKPVNEHSKVKKVIGVVSGKGGVGKSLVTGLLACEMKKRGFKTAIMDADITGPSIPKMFGLHERAKGSDIGLYPAITENDIKVMSLNLLTENETDPVIWRGPVIAGVVTQFWTDVVWSDVDFMFVDMPPGTGDVPLTVFQSLPVDGIVIVASPQDLVGMIVTKAVNMARMMNIPILGMVENFAWYKCPDCGSIHKIFGESGVERAASETGVPILASVPIDQSLAEDCDKGEIYKNENSYLADAALVIAAAVRME